MRSIFRGGVQFQITPTIAAAQQPKRIIPTNAPRCYACGDGTEFDAKCLRLNMALTRSQIAQMIAQPEGPLIERKPPRVNTREIRQTVVAFANTVSGEDEAVLFVGVRDDGLIEGCKDTDAMQKTVRDVCDNQCYPAIAFRIEILPEHKNVNEHEQTRNTKTAKQHKNKKQHTNIRVIGLGQRLSEARLATNNRYREFAQCKVLECNAQYARFERCDGTGGRFSAPLENVTITYNEEKWCPELIIKGF